MASPHGLDEITKAKLLLVLLAFVWGLSWPVMTIALMERFASQGRADYANRLLARMRQSFGGHAVKSS